MRQFNNFSLSPEEKFICESLVSCHHTPPTVKHRIKFVLLKSEGKTVYEISRCCNTSRTNVYKWLSRYRPNDRTWYLEQSRRPRRCPNKIPDAVEKVVVNLNYSLKKSGYQSDTASIKYEMENLCLNRIPSLSSIHRILKKHGLKKDRTAHIRTTNNANRSPTPINTNHKRIPAKKRNSQKTLFISDQERKTLETRKRSPSAKAGMSKRSEIILLLADGLAPIGVARTLRISRQMVYKWIKRFSAHSLDGLLRPAPASWIRGVHPHLLRSYANFTKKCTRGALSLQYLYHRSTLIRLNINKIVAQANCFYYGE